MRRLRQMHREDLEKANDQLNELQSNYKEHQQEYKDLQNIKSEIRANVDRTREVYKWLDSAEDDAKRIEIRRLLQKEIQRLVDWIKIYPLTEKYEPGPVEVEQDIYKVMKSKSIEKIRIKYKNIDQLTILPMVQYLDGTVKAYKLVRSRNQ